MSVVFFVDYNVHLPTLIFAYLTRLGKDVSVSTRYFKVGRIRPTSRPNFFLRSSRNRVDLLLYESKTTDKRGNTTGGLRKVWMGNTMVTTDMSFKMAVSSWQAFLVLLLVRQTIVAGDNSILGMYCTGAVHRHFAGLACTHSIVSSMLEY